MDSDLNARETELRERIRERPGDAEALRELALLVGSERTRKAEAVVLWERHLEAVEEGGRGAALMALGRAQIEARRNEDAIESLAEATRADPGLAEAFDLLGELLRGTGRVEEAVSALERATQLDPKNVRARLALVTCLDALDRKDQATRVLQQAAEIGGEDPATQALIREFMHRRG